MYLWEKFESSWNLFASLLQLFAQLCIQHHCRTCPRNVAGKKSFKVSTLLCANLQLEIDSFNICWIILHQKRMRRKVGRMKMYNNFYLGGGISFKQGTEAVKRREKLLWKLYWSWVGVVVGWRAAVGGVTRIWFKSSERRFVNFRIVRFDFQIIEA